MVQKNRVCIKLAAERKGGTFEGRPSWDHDLNGQAGAWRRRLPCRLLENFRKKRNILKVSAFSNCIGKGTIDDIGCVELLLDQTRPKIQIDGLLLVGHYAVIDRRDTDFRPAQPVERYGGREVSPLAPRLCVSADMGQRPGASRREPAKEVLELRPLIANRVGRSDLKADAGRNSLGGDYAPRLEQHFFLANIRLPCRPRINGPLCVGNLCIRR